MKKKPTLKESFDTVILASDDALSGSPLEVAILLSRLRLWTEHRTSPASDSQSTQRRNLSLQLDYDENNTGGDESTTESIASTTESIASTTESIASHRQCTEERNGEDIIQTFSELPLDLRELLLKLPGACDALGSVSEQEWHEVLLPKEDPRVQHIRRAEETHKTYKPSPSDRLKACLAARSLAEGYREFQRDLLKKNASVKQYTRETPSFVDKDAAERGTNRGRRLESAERMSGEPGISAVFSQVQRDFDRLSIEHIPLLCRYLGTEPFKRILATAHKWTPTIQEGQQVYKKEVQSEMGRMALLRSLPPRVSGIAKGTGLNGYLAGSATYNGEEQNMGSEGTPHSHVLTGTEGMSVDRSRRPAQHPTMEQTPPMEQTPRLPTQSACGPERGRSCDDGLMAGRPTKRRRLTQRGAGNTPLHDTDERSMSAPTPANFPCPPNSGCVQRTDLETGNNRITGREGGAGGQLEQGQPVPPIDQERAQNLGGATSSDSNEGRDGRSDPYSSTPLGGAGQAQAVPNPEDLGLPMPLFRGHFDDLFDIEVDFGLQNFGYTLFPLGQ